MNCSALAQDPGHLTKVAYERARSSLAFRKRRAELFNVHIFSDPAWDVLLHLFVHEHVCGAISRASLADMVGTGQSTIASWLAALADEELVRVAIVDPVGEPAFAITERGRGLMLDVFLV